ncbi:synaptic vesicle glycoprotein 2A, putative [Phytophthora infestans T30-4]|uniref:Synaptic vesicle glycoprotein 2A, putative n=1 Tax=Phytophthora infestans (strain T30-4) TaxID=403677 RepID=D0MRI2_PHYIT|nr:synaptic vesicle glycoprotein 2A, putative [Phytophthora infestans T30-4]EEY58101.1 synaptic vesicle glycoprotein 2A, putative [Phytophthora infestans T30-4]|eukprot:XP_002909287.1 synaptic vesicle glycoprotein 2A, putative [Phytophthora infestans T30-4]
MADEGFGSARLLRIEQLRHAIANISDGFFQLRVVLILGLGNAADAVEILSIGYILAVYEDKEGVVLTRTQQSLLAAAIFAGMFTGGLLFGSLSDQIGRRKSLLYSLLLNGIFGLMSALSPNVYALIAFRTCAGIGGTVPAIFTLCSEHVPANRRGYYVTIVAAYWMVVCEAAFASFAAIVSLPSFVCWTLTYKYVPESAQFFARRRLLTDAEKVVDTIKTTNGDDAAHATESSSLLTHQNTGASDMNVFAPLDTGIQTRSSTLNAYGMLFDPVLRGTTMSLLMSWFCLSFGSYGLATWITMLFKRIGLEDPFANAFIYAAANLPGNVMTALLMDRLGGRRILAISMLLSAGCATGFAYANSSASGAAAIVLLASGFNTFSTAGWNAIDLMSAESFPTDVRTTGMGTLSAAGRAGSVAAQFVNGYLIGPPVHVKLLLAITASMMLLGTISSVLVRDFSNKALPDSVEEMRAKHEKINSVLC